MIEALSTVDELCSRETFQSANMIGYYGEYKLTVSTIINIITATQ